jgi:hypothetical protein
VTGRVADGWIVPRADEWLSRRYAESRPIIDEAAVSVGRDPSEIATVYNMTGRITDAPLPATRNDSGRWVGGSVEQWVEELTAAVVDHGAAAFLYHPTSDGAPRDVALGRWAREVVPAVRKAIGQT